MIGVGFVVFLMMSSVNQFELISWLKVLLETRL